MNSDEKKLAPSNSLFYHIHGDGRVVPTDEAPSQEQVDVGGSGGNSAEGGEGGEATDGEASDLPDDPLHRGFGCAVRSVGDRLSAILAR